MPSSRTLTSSTLSQADNEPLTSLVFHVPFPEDSLVEQARLYESLRTPEVKALNGAKYHETCARLALEAYDSADIRVRRETWTEASTRSFTEVVSANTYTLKHIEIILPSGGIAEPLDLFPSLAGVEGLESFALQWPRSVTVPVSIIPATYLGPIFAKFMTSLHAFLSTHARILKRLRISLPAATMQEPLSELSLTPSTLPSLPHLEVLDLTHSAPFFPVLALLLGASSPVPHLQHLILDQGFSLPTTDMQAACDSDDEDDEDGEEAPSWPAIGRLLALRATPLRSLSAALCDEAGHMGTAPRLTQSKLKHALEEGARAAVPGTEDSLRGLTVVTAWPVTYAEKESGDDTEESVDLVTHAPGCGHLAYPEDQRPTTGLWLAVTPEGSSIQAILGKK